MSQEGHMNHKPNNQLKLRVPYSKKFNSFIDNKLGDLHEKQTMFYNDMLELTNSDNDSNYVTCIPARCGIGKSTFIQAYIRACIDGSFSGQIGVIVITDTIRRLEGLVSSEIDNKGKESAWNSFISTYINGVAVLKSYGEPFNIQLERQIDKPVILLSTQRYFMLDKDTRERLFTFRYRNMTYQRNRVFFDESPYFNKIVNIDIETLNKIDTAIKKLDETVQSKDKLIIEFELFSRWLQDVMSEKEKMRDKSLTLYWKEKNQDLVRKDIAFLNSLLETVGTIDNVYSDIKNIIFLMQKGGLFFSQKKKDSNEYKKGFALSIDNREAFYLGENKAKFFVFDGTCDIDPNYKVDYVRLVDCSKYNLPLNLKITNISIPTSQAVICNKGEKARTTIETILRYLGKECLDIDLLIITYKKIIKRFAERYKSVGYFGGIKGLNDYNKFYNMAHIGMNRYTDISYFLMYCNSNPMEYKHLITMSEEESIQYFDEILRSKKKIESTIVGSMLADFEQNLFRLAIRNYDNNNKVNIWTFYNNSSPCYKALSKRIEERYRPLGAEFEYLEKPAEYRKKITMDRKPAKGKESTYPQKIIEFLTAHSTFLIDDLRKYVGITNQGIYNAKNRNAAVKAEFEKFEKAGKYKYVRKSTQ
jgi:hypothetical protein